MHLLYEQFNRDYQEQPEYKAYHQKLKNYIFALKRYLYFKKTDKPLRRRLRSVALPLKKVYKPPALSQQTFAAYSRTFAGSAAIFHVLLTPGWGLYFFFSPAGAKPANRFGGDLKVYF